MQSLPEESENPSDNETNPGAFVLLNYDDDNNNSKRDMDETSASGDKDIIPVSISYFPKMTEGEISLEIVSGSDKIKLWETQNKGSLLEKTKWNLTAKS